MKKIILLFVLISCLNPIIAQVGINTQNPQALFHIDGSRDNNTSGTPTSTQQANDLVVTENGNVGIGTTTPKVKLDLRSSGTNNSIGIDYTSMTAAQAGAGAVRYLDQSGGIIQISNGVVWQNIPSVPVKSSVVARINAGNNSHRFLYNTVKNVDNWQEMIDANSNFDPVTGLFTAPRKGIYTISFTFNFLSGPINLNSNVESQVLKNGNTIAVKCLKTYGKSTRPAQAGGNCVTSISLEEGETINVRLLQTIDNTTTGGRGLRSISSPPNAITHPFFGFNNLTIVEQ